MAINIFGLGAGNILGNLGVAMARPQFELQFNILQNAVLKRLNEKVTELNNKSGGENDVVDAELRLQGKHVDRMMPLIDSYVRQVAKARTSIMEVSTSLDKLYTAVGNADATTFNSVRTEMNATVQKMVSPDGFMLGIYVDDGIPSLQQDTLGIEEYTADASTGPIRLTASLGGSPMTTTSGSTTVAITQAGHGAQVGDYVTLSGATDVNGIPAADLNKQLVVTSVQDANTFSVQVATAATASGSGAGSAVQAVHRSTTSNQVIAAMDRVSALNTALLNRQEDAVAMYDNYKSQQGSITLQIQSAEVAAKAEKIAEIKKLKEQYGYILQAISLSFEVQVSQNEALAKQMSSQGRPEPGTIMDLFS